MMKKNRITINPLLFMSLMAVLLAGCVALAPLPEESMDSTDAEMDATEMEGPVDLLITNARLFDATGADVMENASIAIAGNRIQAISTGETDVEATTVIDAEG